jgi:hypothetical protein
MRQLLEKYRNNPDDCELDPLLKAVAVEVALYNRVRYPWADIKPLYHILIDACLDQYKVDVVTEDDDETATLIGKTFVEKDESGTADLSSLRDDTEIFIRCPSSEDQGRKEIHALLDMFRSEPPFTIHVVNIIICIRRDNLGCIIILPYSTSWKKMVTVGRYRPILMCQKQTKYIRLFRPLNMFY